MKLFLHVQDPDSLSDEDFMENVRQLEWLADKGLLGVKTAQSQ